MVSESPRTCGRGSGAASLVAYCLGITNVCPVKHNLYFERFLNPGRKKIRRILTWILPGMNGTGCFNVFWPGTKVIAPWYPAISASSPGMALRETARVSGLPEGEISR
ncbi:MAG: hypothetical protein R2874_02935 [Desulfobacterales bacterium]